MNREIACIKVSHNVHNAFDSLTVDSHYKRTFVGQKSPLYQMLASIGRIWHEQIEQVRSRIRM